MLAERAGRDDGMTVVEVMIVSAIMMVVMAIAFGGLVTLTNSENRTQAMVANEQSVRFVLSDFARDIRGADPVTHWASSDDYAFKIQMEVGPTGDKSLVLWEYDPAARTITRSVTAGPGSPSTVVRVTSVRNQERGYKFLQYFDAAATATAADDDTEELVDAGEPPGTIADCSIRVRVTVAADSNPGPEPFVESLDVHLRNRLPGGFGCPV